MDQLFIVPQTRNPGSTPGHTHPLKILATRMQLQLELQFNVTIAATSCICIKLSYIGLYAGNMVMFIELGINLICSLVLKHNKYVNFAYKVHSVLLLNLSAA